jgi:3-oxoacyl-[acyl-carrier-protein] synthase II
MQMKRVVITGLGALTPIGNSREEYWTALLAGRSGSAPITRFDAAKFKTRFAAEVKAFNAEDHLDRKEARKMDPFTHYAIVVADEALADSGMALDKADKDRIGVVWGSGIGGVKTFQDECFNFAKGDGTPRFNPFLVPKMISDSASGYISMRHGFRGPSYCTVAACASSNNALIDAYNYIRLGMCDAFVTGGSEAAVTESCIGGFNSLTALSTRNDDPATASRPYDKDRDGFVLGEGAAALVLEDLDLALARGARIYCEVVGAGLSSDAYHITAPHPEGLGAFLSMKHALAGSGLQPSDIHYVNTHGTSTPIGDPQEVAAIQRLFGDHAYALNISSTKSMIGHLLGAAGAAEAVASVLAVQRDMVPPTINHFTDDPVLDPKLNFTFNKAQARTVDAALSNTFGFGGHNTTVIFRKYRS